MLNFFTKNKTKTADHHKIGKRQHRRIHVDKKVEQFTRQLQHKSIGLVGDRLDESISKDMITGSINRAIRSSAKRLYDQGRTLALNTAIGARYVQYVCDHVVGTGLDPKPMITDKDGKIDLKLNSAIENVFWSWAGSQKRFSRNGRFNFRELLAMCEKERILGGEAFVVIHDDEKEFTVSILSADKCDWNLCEKKEKTTIYNGIEYDNETLKPVYYWFRRYDLFTQSFTGKNYRVDADKVLHYFIPSTSEAMRGVTDFLPVIKDIAHMDAFRETAIIQKRISASSMGFIERPKETGNDFDIGDDDELNYQPPAMVTDFEPGTIQELEAGATIKSIQSNQGGDDFDKFNDAMLTSISMGLCSFKQGLVGDTSQINYSSARFGSLTERNRFKNIQNRLIDIVVLPIFEAFLRNAVIHSKINVRMTQIDNIILNTTVIRPKVESVDPIKDVNTEITLIQNGLKSRSSVILERGDDPEKVFSEIQAEKANINIHVESDATHENITKDE